MPGAMYPQIPHTGGIGMSCSGHLAPCPAPNTPEIP